MDGWCVCVCVCAWPAHGLCVCKLNAYTYLERAYAGVCVLCNCVLVFVFLACVILPRINQTEHHSVLQVVGPMNSNYKH